MQNKEELTVGGFIFHSKQDAELARQEEEKIEYINKRLNYNKPEHVLNVYRKALENRAFKTPVGYQYLYKLKEYLEANIDGPEKAPPIPLYTTFDHSFREDLSPARERIKGRKKGSPIVARYRFSIVMNLLLTVMIIIMFVIAVNSSRPNILNYEHNLQNKYAAWEQELRQREEYVREKERALNSAE